MRVLITGGTGGLGEKLAEEMIITSDSFETYDIGDKFVIIPDDLIDISGYEREFLKKHKVEEKFYYASDSNKDFLNFDKIRKLIKLNLNKDFNPT